MTPLVEGFFDEDTNTVSYVVADKATGACAIVDSVLDFNPKSGRTSTKSAERIVDFVRCNSYKVEWILETHVHADHLSAAPFVQAQVGGQIAIGERITTVQHVFGELYNVENDFRRDGSQFDRLLADGDELTIGNLVARAIHTPGHTPACMTYVIGDAAFVGDTLFMPDYGTARVDFPGGDARTLYRSIQKIFALPPQTRLFMCHDYLPDGRDEYCWETTVAEQREHNVHVHDGTTESDFIEFRTKRDAGLDMPRLILPSIQVNMRAGNLPPAEDNGIHYLKIPLDAI
ncbi:MAG: MBL fold metallo-hydrolase [Gammaproteobacteria bacterium]|nr:MBL fold metallo-hydrolase [Gammaproteobacteria bacterium]